MTHLPSFSHLSYKERQNNVPRLLVFDSGIGGMGFVQAIQKNIPSLSIDYLADTAFFPYGEKDDIILTERILSLILKAVELLSPSLIVIACNTASTLVLAILREHLSIPIVGSVPPIRWAGRISQTRTIGLLATSATARRPYIHHLHQEFAADCHLLIHGARPLADLAEKAFYGIEIPQEQIKAELECLFTQKEGHKIDVIGLGCTHYTFLMPYFQKLNYQHITWLDPAPAVAQQAIKKLKEANYSFPYAISKPNRIFTTSSLQGESTFIKKTLEPLKKMGFTEQNLLRL